jgi:hypothetical protein
MAEFSFFKPGLNLLGVNMDEILDLMRERNRTSENPVFCEVEEIFHQLPDICDIRGGYVVLENVEISPSEGKIRCEDRKIDAGRKVCRYMKGARNIAVFICTAGERFSRLSEKFNSEKDYLKGYIVDTFGSVTAEKTADFLQKNLQTECRKNGFEITNRYSPGYCNWTLSQQKQLFDFLPDNKCDISLTESMLMKPVKSISGIIGIGENVKMRKYACEACNDHTCTYRNILSNNK